MRRYPAYKDSGVEWIGEIPANWELCKIKYSSYVKGRIGWQGLKSSEFIDNGFAFLITGMHFKNNRVDWTSCYQISENRYNQSPEIHIRQDDLLITKDGTIGKLAYIDHLPGKATLNSHILVIRPIHNQFINRFLFWVFHSDTFKKYVDMTQTGTTFYGITQEKLEEFLFPIPSLNSQYAINDFLKQKTSQIDSLIEKKKRLIELLKEYRTAIINHAVTKGLDPNVKMKDSGIEWIGEIPEHWEVRPLKFLLKGGQEGIKIGPFGSSLKLEIMKTNGFKVYGQENVIYENFDLGRRYIDEKTFKNMKVYTISPGDVLITTMGTTGRSIVAPNNIKNGIMDSHLIRLRVNEKINPRLLSLLINDSYFIHNQIKRSSKGSIMEGLNSTIVKSLLILLPKRNEQDQILNSVNSRLHVTDNIIEKTLKEIELLEEYRASLISDAVTGKIDVRGYDEQVLEQAK